MVHDRGLANRFVKLVRKNYWNYGIKDIVEIIVMGEVKLALNIGDGEDPKTELEKLMNSDISNYENSGGNYLSAQCEFIIGDAERKFNI